MIGVIVRTDKHSAELSEDWNPEPIDAQALEAAFAKVLGFVPASKEFCYDKHGSLIHFTVDSFTEPLAITFSCSAGGSDALIVDNLASELDAKIYDSESCDFVEL